MLSKNKLRHLNNQMGRLDQLAEAAMAVNAPLHCQIALWRVHLLMWHSVCLWMCCELLDRSAS